MVQDLKVGGLAVEQKLNMCLQNSICFADKCFVSGEGKESLQEKNHLPRSKNRNNLIEVWVKMCLFPT